MEGSSGGGKPDMTDKPSTSVTDVTRSGQPSVSGGQPSVSGGQPGVSGGQPGVSGGQPGVSGRQPGVSGGQSGVSGGQSGVSGGQPGVSGGQPGVSGGQSGVSGGQSGVSGGQSGVSGGQPGVSGGQPGVSGGQSGVSGGQPGVSGGQSGVTDQHPFVQKENKKPVPLPRSPGPSNIEAGASTDGAAAEGKPTKPGGRGLPKTPVVSPVDSPDDQPVAPPRRQQDKKDQNTKLSDGKRAQQTETEHQGDGDNGQGNEEAKSFRGFHLVDESDYENENVDKKELTLMQSGDYENVAQKKLAFMQSGVHYKNDFENVDNVDNASHGGGNGDTSGPLQSPSTKTPDLTKSSSSQSSVDTPTGPSQSSGDTPIGPSQSSGDTPIGPSQSSGDTPIGPSQSSGDTPIGQSQSFGDTLTGPSQSSGDTPIGPSQSSGDTPIGPSQSSGDTPTGPSQSSGDTPIGPSQSSGDTPIGPSQSSGDTPIGQSQSSGDTLTGPSQSSGDTSTRPSQSSDDTPIGPSQSSGDTPTGPSQSSGDTPIGPSQSSGDTPIGPSQSSDGTPTSNAQPSGGAPKESSQSSGGAPKESSQSSGDAPSRNTLPSGGAPKESSQSSGDAPKGIAQSSDGAPTGPSQSFSDALTGPSQSSGDAPTRNTQLSGDTPKESSQSSGDTPKESSQPSGDTPKESSQSSGGAPKESSQSSGDTPKETSQPSGDTPKESSQSSGGAPKESSQSSGDTPKESSQPSGDTPKESSQSSGGAPKESSQSSGDTPKGIAQSSDGAPTGPSQSSGDTLTGPSQSSGDTLTGPSQSSGHALTRPSQPSGDTLTGPSQSSGDTLTGPSQSSGDTLTGPSQSSGHALTRPSQSSGHALTGPSQPSGDTLTGPSQPTGDTLTGPSQPSGDTPKGSSQPSGDAHTENSQSSGDAPKGSSQSSGDANTGNAQSSGDAPSGNPQSSGDALTGNSQSPILTTTVQPQNSSPKSSGTDKCFRSSTTDTTLSTDTTSNNTAQSNALGSASSTSASSNYDEDPVSKPNNTSNDSDLEVLGNDKEEETSEEITRRGDLPSIQPPNQAIAESISLPPEEPTKEEATKHNEKDKGNVAAGISSKDSSAEKNRPFQVKLGRGGKFYFIKSDTCSKPFTYTPKYGEVLIDEDEDDLLYDGDHCFYILIKDGTIVLDEIVEAETTNTTPTKPTESGGKVVEESGASANVDNVNPPGNGQISDDVSTLADKFKKLNVQEDDKTPKNGQSASENRVQYLLEYFFYHIMESMKFKERFQQECPSVKLHRHEQLLEEKKIKVILQSESKEELDKAKEWIYKYQDNFAFTDFSYKGLQGLNWFEKSGDIIRQFLKEHLEGKDVHHEINETAHMISIWSESLGQGNLDQATKEVRDSVRNNKVIKTVSIPMSSQDLKEHVKQSKVLTSDEKKCVKIGDKAKISGLAYIVDRIKEQTTKSGGGQSTPATKVPSSSSQYTKPKQLKAGSTNTKEPGAQNIEDRGASEQVAGKELSWNAEQLQEFKGHKTLISVSKIPKDKKWNDLQSEFKCQQPCGPRLVYLNGSGKALLIFKSQTEDPVSKPHDTSNDSDVEVLEVGKEEKTSEKTTNGDLASIPPPNQAMAESVRLPPKEPTKEEAMKHNEKDKGNVAAGISSKDSSAEKNCNFQLKLKKGFYLINTDACPKPFKFTPKYGEVSINEEDNLLYDGDQCFSIFIEDGRIKLDEILDVENTNTTPPKPTESGGTVEEDSGASAKVVKPPGNEPVSDDVDKIIEDLRQMSLRNQEDDKKQQCVEFNLYYYFFYDILESSNFMEDFHQNFPNVKLTHKKLDKENKIEVHLQSAEKPGDAKKWICQYFEDKAAVTGCVCYKDIECLDLFENRGHIIRQFLKECLKEQDVHHEINETAQMINLWSTSLVQSKFGATTTRVRTAVRKNEVIKTVSIAMSSTDLVEHVKQSKVLNSDEKKCVKIQSDGDKAKISGLAYIVDGIKEQTTKSGFLSALPYIGFWAMTNVSGHLADLFRKKGYMSTTSARKLFNSLGTLVPALFVIITGHIDGNPGFAVAMLIIGVAMSGCQYGSGFIVNPVDIAPRYAGIIFGISNTTGTLGGFLAPIAIGFITSDKTREQWQTVFYIAAAIYTVEALFYIVFGSGEVQPWALDTDNDIAVTEKLNDAERVDNTDEETKV